jgi:hypothetical protein
MEQAARNRQDNVIRRLRDNVKRLGEEKEELQRGDGSTGESLRRAHRQIRELKDDLLEKEKKEQEMSRKNRQMESEREAMETNFSTVQKELERANKRIQDLREALQRFSDQSDADTDDILDDSASSGGEDDGRWTAKDGDRKYKRRHLYSSDLDEEESGTTAATTRRIADVDDFDNITPNTLHKWRTERQTDDDSIGGKREGGDEHWYSNSASYRRGLEDALDCQLPRVSTPERGKREPEKAWFEDSTPPGSPKPAYL